MPIRQPIAVVLGHVDHGKTTLLDRLRGTSVAAREPGQITQWIGASLIPAKTLTEIIGPLLERFKLTIEVPGILFIDTPGHETFSNLRKRGGSAADVAILVIDVTKGIEPQTVESLTILKARKTPFLISCNKIDAEPGLGVTIDAMIYNGRLEVDDQIMIAGRNGVIGTRVRALLLPKPLDEIRDPRDKFSNVKSVDAAAGIKIAAAGLEDAIAGSSLYGVKDASSRKPIKERILSEVEEVRVKKDLSGVVVKSDALGSLEALTTSLEASKIPVRLADVGDVSRRDVVEAKAVRVKDQYLGVVLAFGVKLLPDAEEEIALSKIPVFKGDVLYHVLEEYSRWVETQRLAGAKAEMDLLIRPGKIKLLKGFVFRRSDPAIVGVEVLDGIIKPKYPLINSRGQRIGQVIRIQDQGKDVGEAGAGKQVAVSIDKPMVGRQINEGDVLYVEVPVQHARVLSSKFKDYPSPAELALLSEMATLTSGAAPSSIG